MKLIILKDDRYIKVKKGEMTCWLTLNDDFAKALQIGELVRIMNDKTSEFCYARINGYYVYDSFDELYKKVNKNELGYDGNDKENIALIKDQMFLQCSPESEKKYGVRGIKFEYLPKYKEPKDMDEGEMQAYLQGMVKGVQKARKQLYRSLEKTSDLTEGLAYIVEKDPELFFASMNGESDDGMLKYLLSESIKNSRILLDKIKKYENK